MIIAEGLCGDDTGVIRFRVAGCIMTNYSLLKRVRWSYGKG